MFWLSDLILVTPIITLLSLVLQNIPIYSIRWSVFCVLAPQERWLVGWTSLGFFSFMSHTTGQCLSTKTFVHIQTHLHLQKNNMRWNLVQARVGSSACINNVNVRKKSNLIPYGNSEWGLCALHPPPHFPGPHNIQVNIHRELQLEYFLQDWYHTLWSQTRNA